MKRMEIDKDLFYMILGIIISAAGYTFFIVPAKLIPGGVSGISIILHHLFNTPFGAVMLAINIPLLLISIKMFGKSFGVRTVIAVFAISILSDLFAIILRPLIFESENLLLGSVYGGVLLGIGLGLVFKGRGSTAGSDIIGKIMNKYTSLSVGYSIFIIDSVIILLSGFVFKSYELILYSFITLFLSSKVIDIILEGKDYARGVLILTDKPEEISKEIIERLNRGVTGFISKGMYSGQSRMSLYCVVSRRQLPKLIYRVKKMDRNAFIVVSNVYEVLGSGFPRR